VKRQRPGRAYGCASGKRRVWFAQQVPRCGATSSSPCIRLHRLKCRASHPRTPRAQEGPARDEAGGVGTAHLRTPPECAPGAHLDFSPATKKLARLARPHTSGAGKDPDLGGPPEARQLARGWPCALAFG
jgi:hypothetical protein